MHSESIVSSREGYSNLTWTVAVRRFEVEDAVASFVITPGITLLYIDSNDQTVRVHKTALWQIKHNTQSGTRVAAISATFEFQIVHLEEFDSTFSTEVGD
ncbi:hypothetical protein Mapa_001766 [Marchantia paleacea]|nr:hypothetical protein Mapa_001766 [Marchantia paleacea]